MTGPDSPTTSTTNPTAATDDPLANLMGMLGNPDKLTPAQVDELLLMHTSPPTRDAHSLTDPVPLPALTHTLRRILQPTPAWELLDNGLAILAQIDTLRAYAVDAARSALEANKQAARSKTRPRSEPLLSEEDVAQLQTAAGFKRAQQGAKEVEIVSKCLKRLHVFTQILQSPSDLSSARALVDAYFPITPSSPALHLPQRTELRDAIREAEKFVSLWEEERRRTRRGRRGSGQSASPLLDHRAALKAAVRGERAFTSFQDRIPIESVLGVLERYLGRVEKDWKVVDGILGLAVRRGNQAPPPPPQPDPTRASTTNGVHRSPTKTTTAAPSRPPPATSPPSAFRATRTPLPASTATPTPAPAPPQPLSATSSTSTPSVFLSASKSARDSTSEPKRKRARISRAYVVEEFEPEPKPEPELVVEESVEVEIVEIESDDEWEMEEETQVSPHPRVKEEEEVVVVEEEEEAQTEKGEASPRVGVNRPGDANGVAAAGVSDGDSEPSPPEPRKSAPRPSSQRASVAPPPPVSPPPAEPKRTGIIAKAFSLFSPARPSANRDRPPPNAPPPQAEDDGVVPDSQAVSTQNEASVGTTDSGLTYVSFYRDRK